MHADFLEIECLVPKFVKYSRGNFKFDFVHYVSSTVRSSQMMEMEVSNRKAMAPDNILRRGQSTGQGNTTPTEPEQTEEIREQKEQEKDQEEEMKDRMYVGLHNQGATCYLNSLLQGIYNTAEFRAMLYSWRYSTNRV